MTIRDGGRDAALLRGAHRVPSSPLPVEESHDADWVRKLIVAGQYTRERACDTKARFALYTHAAKAKGDIEARPTFDGIPLIIYPCPFCGGFHFASQKEIA